LELAERGHNRDGENLPQINLASVHDRDGGLPLFYRITQGSIADTSTLSMTGQLMKDFGMQDFRFILDRGFCSQCNMAEMIGGGISFTMAVPLTSGQAKKFVLDRRKKLGSPKHAFAWNGESLQHMQGEWTVPLSDGKQATCTGHLYLDNRRRAAEESRLLAKIILIEAKAAETPFARSADAHAWINANAHKLRKYLRVTTADGGKTFIIGRKNHALAVRGGMMGLTLIVTTDGKMSKEEVLAEYRSRDCVEKAYDILKNENGQRRLHICTRDEAEGRMFLAFIALVISCELDRRMRKSELYSRYTTAEVLSEMAKARQLHLANGTSRLLEISKTQRTLLEKLEIPPLQKT
jgi:transposase